MKARKIERIEKQKSGAMGRWGIPSDFPRHFFASVAIENSLRPMIRWGEEVESVDRTGIGASAVTCENRKRELSPPVVLHVLLPLFLPSIRSFGTPTLNPLICSFSPLSRFLTFESVRCTNVKINAKKKREKERKNGNVHCSPKPSFILPFDWRWTLMSAVGQKHDHA